MRRSCHALALVLTSLVASTGASSGAAGLFQGSETLSRAETARRVKDELARRLKVNAGEIQLVAESDETWPDSTLGCSPRKPLGEPIPTPGFAFTVSYRGRSFVYHTDRLGRLRRCETVKPVKPIGC